MSKIKVHELAKKLGKTSKDLILGEKKHSEEKSAKKKEIKKETKAKATKKEEKKKEPVKKVPEKIKPRAKLKAPVKEAKPAVLEKKEPPKKEPEISKSREPVKKEKVPLEEPQIAAKPAEKIGPEKIVIKGERIVLRDLAEAMRLAPAELIKEFLLKGYMITINQEVDSKLAEKAITKFGFQLEKEEKVKKVSGLEFDETLYQPQRKNLKPRPPVITIMGHVDHGKTKLLDAIRNSNVIATEAGNITQHIGAYRVNVHHKNIVLLDTPGHVAFTALRARGAQVTDIAILVVAADDGVMPQTIEAYDHAKAAGVPVIVAINKIDKPEANQQRVKQQITDLGLVPEEWGGDTVVVPISAKLNQGINELLEMVLLVAEMQELKADPTCLAEGVVIEAKMDRNRGAVATVMIKNGTLKIGDAFWCGATFGKVKAIFDDRLQRIKEVTPGLPGEILGFSAVPESGDILRKMVDEKKARELAEARALEKAQEKSGKVEQVSLENLYNQLKAGEVQDLNLVLKADVQGSIEAIVQSLSGITVGDVKINLLHSATGEISESDVMLAMASKAVIIGFNVGVNPQAKALAEEQLVEIKLYQIIYHFLDDIKLAMEGMLKPEYEEVVVGRAEVRALFKSSKVGTIAGCFVINGKMQRGAGLRLYRENAKIYEGKLESLKRFKDDAREVAAGFECGVSLSNFNEFLVGDILEAFEVREKSRTQAKTSGK